MKCSHEDTESEIYIGTDGPFCAECAHYLLFGGFGEPDYVVGSSSEVWR